MSKIADIILEEKGYKYIKPFHIAHNVSTSVVNIEVSVILDSGAKGFGELPLMGIAPSIASALRNATGIKFNTIPLTPERILKKIKRKIK